MALSELKVRVNESHVQTFELVQDETLCSEIDNVQKLFVWNPYYGYAISDFFLL